MTTPPPANGATTLLWFRNDLRLADHAALHAALKRGGAVVPVFVFDSEAAGRWAPGGASRWWLHHSLARLAEAVEAVGSRLVVRKGNTEAILAELAAETGATAVTCSRRYEPWAIAQEERVRARLITDGVELKRYSGTLLIEPEAIATGSGGPYKVYSPFWRALLEAYRSERPSTAPTALPPPDRWPQSEPLASLALLPTEPNWAGGFAPLWQPGEMGARKRLERFLDEAATGYAEDRNRPDLEATSRLSPHLAFGEISPRTVWWATASRLGGGAPSKRPKGGEKGLETFLKELVWREFSNHLLFHFPTLPEKPFRPEFAAFPWRSDEAMLRAWQKGRTGYPIVDAGMRQLWATGWMHNRVRMIVASFLIKDLLIPWQDGEAWFWDTLVDADLANNAASWQWVAGSGADAAPYFRIFNPITQGIKFDPEGAYVRRWVPEIATRPGAEIHQPLEHRSSRGYPAPIVDHKAARECALQAFEAIKSARTG
ncbi:MAG: cryptochrome/photolyase family protein [Hyphomicrobiaceae bacterium]